MTDEGRPSGQTGESTIEAPECLRRFFTSARSRREAAALSRAAWRCSGVRGGKATKAILLGSDEVGRASDGGPDECGSI